jgi:2-polyprenyl-3-methyl-5-hydroxy-6-metoxy-1,4-benzoquinol methylase
MQTAKEFQNQPQFDTYFEKGGVRFGPYTSHMWRSDPRKMVCLFSRYKFVAKMLAGKDRVLEIGCGDSIGTPIVLQTVNSVHGLDFEPIVIEDAQERNEYNDRCTYSIHDITSSPMPDLFDAAFALDVIEHIEPAQEHKFIENIAASLKNDGVLILGTPNITAHQYASEGSRLGHINLKSAETMKASLSASFENVFIFSMNDEVIHTGFSPMAHYIIGMGVGRKRQEGKS